MDFIRRSRFMFLGEIESMHPHPLLMTFCCYFNIRTHAHFCIQYNIFTNSSQNVQQAEQIREVVREEVENLQDEMEEKLRNLHIDMINQFHLQSQELETVLSKHFSALERLTAENQQLREENEMLRQGPRG